METEKLTRKINGRLDGIRTSMNKIERGGCLDVLKEKLEKIKTEINSIIFLTGDEPTKTKK